MILFPLCVSKRWKDLIIRFSQQFPFFSQHALITFLFYQHFWMAIFTNISRSDFLFFKILSKFLMITLMHFLFISNHCLDILLILRNFFKEILILLLFIFSDFFGKSKCFQCVMIFRSKLFIISLLCASWILKPRSHISKCFCLLFTILIFSLQHLSFFFF